MTIGGGGGIGKGGLGRGRGDAPIFYGQESSSDGVGFKAQKLNPGKTISREWQVVGVKRTAAEVDPRRDKGVGNAGSVGPGRATSRRGIAPRHRQLLRKYFDKKGIQKK